MYTGFGKKPAALLPFLSDSPVLLRGRGFVLKNADWWSTLTALGPRLWKLIRHRPLIEHPWLYSKGISDVNVPPPPIPH